MRCEDGKLLFAPFSVSSVTLLLSLLDVRRVIACFVVSAFPTFLFKLHYVRGK